MFHSSANVSRAARLAWIRPARSATTFWTPTLLVAALTLLLVLLWPRGHRHAAARSMPEPGAAYVTVEGALSGIFDPEGIARHSPQVLNGRSALLDDPESAAPRRLPAPEYLGLGPVANWAPAGLVAGSNALPDLASRPFAAPSCAGLRPPTNGLQVVLSAGLQRCGFAFEVPPEAVTGAAAVVRLHIETDASGRVAHLLAEPSDNPAGARLIEAAANTGRAARAGIGDVQVSWGR